MNYDSSYSYCSKFLIISDSSLDDVFFAAKVACLTGNLNHSYWLINYAMTTLDGNNFLSVVEDSDLVLLFNNEQYALRLNILFDSLLNERNKNYSQQLRYIYHAMYVDDQNLRRELKVTSNKDSLFNLITIIDSINLVKLQGLIDSLGFLPDRRYVGLDMSIVPFLIIQHGDPKTRKRFLPFFEEECKKENFPKFVYPYLLDRVLMDEDSPQVFGTQILFENGISELYKCRDLPSIQKRRDEYGLPNFESYLQSMGISLNEK